MIFDINTTRDISGCLTYNNFEISLVLFMPNITTNHAITYIYLKIWVCFTLFSLGVLNNARQGSNQPIKVDAIVDSLKLEKTTKVSVHFFLGKFYSHFASKTNTVWHEIFVVLIFAIFPAIAKISSREKKIYSRVNIL